MSTTPNGAQQRINGCLCLKRSKTQLQQIHAHKHELTHRHVCTQIRAHAHTNRHSHAHLHTSAHRRTHAHKHACTHRLLTFERTRSRTRSNVLYDVHLVEYCSRAPKVDRQLQLQLIRGRRRAMKGNSTVEGSELRVQLWPGLKESRFEGSPVNFHTGMCAIGGVGRAFLFENAIILCQNSVGF